jgi:hypothetical protein
VILLEALSAMEVLCDPAALCLSQTFGGASRLGDRSWGQVPGVFRAAQGNKKGHLLAFCEAL